MKGAKITPRDIDYARKVGQVFALRLPGFDPDDAEGIALLALVESARRWRKSFGATLISFAYTRIRGAILDAHRARWGRYAHRSASDEYTLNDEIDGEAARAELTVEIGEALDVAADLPDQRLVTMLVRHRMLGETQEETGRHLGLSKSWVCRLDQRLGEILEEKLGRKAA